MTTYTTPFPQLSPSPYNPGTCSDIRIENGFIIRTMPSMLSAKSFSATNMKDKRDIIDGLIQPKKTRRASVPCDMRSIPSNQKSNRSSSQHGKVLPAIPEDDDEPNQRPRFFSVGSNTANSSSFASLALSRSTVNRNRAHSTLQSPTIVAPVEQDPISYDMERK